MVSNLSSHVHCYNEDCECELLNIVTPDKLIIALLMLLMIGSLGSAFWYMIKDRGKSDRTVKALTARISIWILLLAIIVGGIYTGWITPSNTVPMPPKSSATQ